MKVKQKEYYEVRTEECVCGKHQYTLYTMPEDIRCYGVEFVPHSANSKMTARRMIRAYTRDLARRVVWKDDTERPDNGAGQSVHG